MAESPVQFFERTFSALSSATARPYEWQKQLYQKFVEGDIPSRVCLPTGTGKTSVIEVWLSALAWQSRVGGRRTVPIRLIWVVDRRAVVDQASTKAAKLAESMSAEECDEVASAIRRFSVWRPNEAVLAVSTLRGQVRDNGDWKTDPSRPAIVVGTVDMIGSRILFSGYGDSYKRRPQHAGLLGYDALLVNDESHLTPAFAALVEQVREFCRGERPLRTMLLSATPRERDNASFPQTLDSDLHNEEFRKRYCAVKRLHLIEDKEPKKAVRRMAGEVNRRTVVFVRSPEDAREVARSISAKGAGARVALLTGEQRGYERDRLPEHPVVKRFLRKEDANSEPCWLVATSAGEVGIDMTSDRLITDLDTADHLLQRFGRLNRFGEADGDAFVIYASKQIEGDKGDAPRLRRTVEYLKGLTDVSTKTLHENPAPREALSAPPRYGPLLPWHVDAWSMTSISRSEWEGRPTVDRWLRGDEEDSQETYVAWRDEVEDLSRARVDDLANALEFYPVIAQERLKQTTGRLPGPATQGSGLLRELDRPEYRETRAILLSADGEIYSGTIGDLIRRRDLAYGTLLLPPLTGGLDLENGMVDWSETEPAEGTRDRYDVSEPGSAERKKMFGDEEPSDVQGWSKLTVEIPGATDLEEPQRWTYFKQRPARVSGGPERVSLKEHHMQAAARMKELTEHLGLEGRIARVLNWAVEQHDTGKARSIWQQAAGNPDLAAPLAKCRNLRARLLSGYRHELGSVLDAEKSLPADFSAEERDLALHLIAAHHGWARPHFPERAHDRENYRASERAVVESARRFGRLQSSLGAWQLAYLESLLRSADAIASATAPEGPT